MPIAFLVASGIFLVNRIPSEQASTTPRPDQTTETQKGVNNETSIHSRLVSHFAQPSSLDDIPIHSVRAVAVALVSFSYFVSQRWWRITRAVSGHNSCRKEERQLNSNFPFLRKDLFLPSNAPGTKYGGHV
jgi:hypothetical protein